MNMCYTLQRILFALIVALVLAPLSLSIAVEPGDKESIATHYEEIISSLKTSNPAPKINKSLRYRTALFAEEFDWDEQTRVRRVADKLYDEVEEAWPTLVKHLGDEDYCLTFRFESVLANCSVGEVCEMIITDSLTAAHVGHVRDERAAKRLLRPEALERDRIQKSWAEQVPLERPLYELQIQMCEWAIGTLRNMELPEEAEKNKAIKAILMQIDKIRGSKTLIRPYEKIVQVEVRMLVSPERAKEFKKREERFGK